MRHSCVSQNFGIPTKRTSVELTPSIDLTLRSQINLQIMAPVGLYVGRVFDSLKLISNFEQTSIIISTFEKSRIIPNHPHLSSVILTHPHSSLRIMKNFLTLFVAGAGLFVASRAYVVELYDTKDCAGAPRSRNVYDNTCAYTSGFQSLKLTAHGGKLQQLSAYSKQACAGSKTAHGCAAGVNSLKLGVCHQATDSSGGSNALSSYSSGGVCPN